MKPDWCPTEVWELVNALPIQSDGFCDDSDLETIARALLEAEQRGRRKGMEESAEIADNYDVSVHMTTVAPRSAANNIANAIRAKLDEVQP